MSEVIRPTAESSVESANESSSDKDSKKKKAIVLGGAASRLVETPAGKETGEREPDRALSVWERFSKMHDGARPAESPFATKADDLSRAAESSKSPAHAAERLKQIPEAETIVDQAKPDGHLERGSEKPAEAEAEKLEALDELSHQEKVETVQRIAEARREALATPNPEDGQNTGTAEDAANAVLLDAIDRELDENPDRPVEEVLDAAEADTMEKIEADGTAPEPTEAAPPDPTPEAIDGEEEDDAGSTTGHTGGAGGAGSTGGPTGSGGPGTPPPITPPPGGGGTGTGGPGGPGYPGGPARTLHYAYAPPAPTPTMYNAPPAVSPNAAPQRIEYQDITAERRAMAQGVLVGGIVGYMLGKRRGRIKTEKRLMPVQKKLEKQVSELEQSMYFKEQNVRKLAAEKAEALKTEQRRQFVESLRPAASESPSRPERGTAYAGSIHERAAAGRAPAEVVRPVVVEAPSVVLGGIATLRPERRPAGAGKLAERDRREASIAVNFNKKVEDYSSEELKQAAEKIKVDGTSLKELYASNRLNEQSIRRVLRDFIEGRSVRAAISRELLETDLKFEKDPKLRNAGSNPAAGTSGTAAGTAGSGSGLAGAARRDPRGSIGAVAASSIHGAPGGKRPVPDKATLDRLRKQQMMQVAALTTAGVAIVAALIALLAG